MSEFIAALFDGLVVLPFFSAVSSVFLWRLYRRAPHRSVLAMLLAADATVGFLAGGYLGALTFNARVLGGTSPPELLPVTLIALNSILVMPNVIAFVLWRSRNGHAK